MPISRDAIAATIEAASAPGFRHQLISRGQARSIIWRNGVLPDDAPQFSQLLSYELHSYAYSMLELGLRLLELNGNAVDARKAFEQAATALEAAIAKGSPEDPDRPFHFVVAAACYHLARLSARAYSLLSLIKGEQIFSMTEQSLASLMTRDFSKLEDLAMSVRITAGQVDAENLADLTADWGPVGEIDDDPRQPDEIADEAKPEDREDHPVLLKAVDDALNDNFSRGILLFLAAFENGKADLIDRANNVLSNGLSVAADLNLVPHWWVHRLAVHIIHDLWETSLHNRLPKLPQHDDAVDWNSLRELFIAVLLKRRRSEVDLWPSQLDAAERSIDPTDDLVVSLPTSAGKTRIAELCILRCLASGMRVMFVTPLRALSAQTETTLQRTFAPLGKTISALYGTIGVSGFDEDAIRTRHIVVATPEKLDFALRNDPGLLNDVGLIIFDEGHMIGLNEREVRYEVQIQRLLRRADADNRRIVCLSAILPDGPQLDDFANWMRRDQDGGVVKLDWRPTRLRYGEVVWDTDHASLNLRVGDEQPYVRRFIAAKAPTKGRRRKEFPCDKGELCVATAWRLVEDGQTVLIFCPVRRNVEPFAKRILGLHKSGLIESLLDVPIEMLAPALTIGAEWLGPDHPILECLKLGVAIHHGALPTAYRKEIENLLRNGILKVTISSPTLAQGLNLTATTVIMHSLFRGQDRIEASEFKNVIGRAGRAYVDIEGLVLFPMFDKIRWQTTQWLGLIGDLTTREMESGLLRLIQSLLLRMADSLGVPYTDLADYVLNNQNAWNFPEKPGEDPQDRASALSDWNGFVTTLDTAILSLLGEHDIADADISARLDQILQSSLWQRRLARRDEPSRNSIASGLLSRAKYIWARTTTAQRKGYFLAGVGMEAGHALDAIAPEANALIIQANGAIISADEATAIQAITRLAELAFGVESFKPDRLPVNWRAIISAWLQGDDIASVAGDDADSVLLFVEQALMYRLTWAMEAMRVRAIANGDKIGDFGLTMADYITNVAVAAIEAGTLNQSAAILIQAGFSSRQAAIKAVRDTAATFETGRGLRDWLQSDDVKALSQDPQWPTQSSHELWLSFQLNFEPDDESKWTKQIFYLPVEWLDGRELPPGEPVRIQSDGDMNIHFVHSIDGELAGYLIDHLNSLRKGLTLGEVGVGQDEIVLTYFGPNDLGSQ